MDYKTSKIPVSEAIPFLKAISDRNWREFCNQELLFIAVKNCSLESIKLWEDVFNFQILPALDEDSRTWIFEMRQVKPNDVSPEYKSLLEDVEAKIKEHIEDYE